MILSVLERQSITDRSVLVVFELTGNIILVPDRFEKL